MTPAYVHAYWGIGDSIYLNPSMRVIGTRHEHVYASTPFPLLFANVPNFRPINPFNFPELVPQGISLAPIYYEHVFGLKHLWRDKEWLADKDRAVVYDTCHNGEGFQKGENVVDHSIADRSIVVGPSPTLYLPWPSDRACKHARQFLEVNRLLDRRLVLFHSHARLSDHPRLPVRCAPDSLMDRLFGILSPLASLYEATKWESDFAQVYAQSAVPVFNSSGWFGFEVMMALIARSVGVVLQSSCCLLPIAQAMRKPVLCCTGTCGTSLVNLIHPGLQVHQRQVVFLEPDSACGCLNNQCPAIESATYSRFESAVNDFRKLTCL
jgi:hypothetical protein